MGTCLSAANYRTQYSPLKKQSSVNCVPTRGSISSVARDVNPDFRMKLIAAYIHGIQYSLTQPQTIHPSITFLIIAYYPKYSIYGIKSDEIDEDCTFTKLPSLEKILLNLTDIHTGQNRFFIKNVYSDIQSFNGFRYSHNAGSMAQLQFKTQNQLFEIPKMELIRNSHSTPLNQWTQFQHSQKRYNRGIDVTIVQIECGISHVLLLSSNGSVYSMGLNHNGECGISKYMANVPKPTLIKEFIHKKCNIQSISCGDYHNCCVGFVQKNKNMNLIWTFGKNQYKQCDEECRQNVLIPAVPQKYIQKNIIKAKCGKDWTICLDKNGGLLTLGNILIEYDNLELFEMNAIVQDFSVGYDHVIIVNNEQQISMVKERENEFVQRRTAFFIDDEAFDSFTTPTALTIGENSILCDMVTAKQYSLMIFEMINI